ncbi:peptidoglycan-associated lipoprotein Pal [Alphaproteobacteria bacterium]|nr:peptidoglycan-associated lipoprotein Pal [Alphaproteobacteria bacterium]
MFQRLIALCAATFFLAACETASQTDTATSSDSSASSTTASSTASSSANSSTGTAGSAEAEAKAALAEVGNTVYFDFDSSALSASGTAMLGRQAAFLKANPSITVTIEGHADERGTREYNLALGDRRASAARDYLIAQGINAARVRTVSYGKERPAMAGSNNAAWAKNRRAATVIN